jgi:uncharacterized protein YqeY
MQDTIQADLKESLKAKDEIRVSTIRFLMSAIHNAKIEKGEELSDEDVVGIIQKQIKQRKESIEGFKQGRRDELVEKETKEMQILQEYLPDQLSESDIEQLVDKSIKDTSSSSINDIGKVMGRLSGELKGKADMGLVSTIVRKKLS